MSKYKLLANVHEGLKTPDAHVTSVHTTRGNYHYYHYCCDNVNDQGWGCGYRTLQTMCSWCICNSKSESSVPSLADIQKTLVKIGDKKPDFIGSRDWIGSFEICLVIDQLYNTPCKIIHLRSGNDLKQHVATLIEHFQKYGSPVMMGGDQDASSKGVFGICRTLQDTYLLIVDPHCRGQPESIRSLQAKGWVKWQPLQDFSKSSFYNLCFPQVAATP